MTLKGAIKQLHELQSAEDMPIYYKPIIAEVINVLLMDTKEVNHGHWIYKEHDYPLAHAFYICSECGYPHGLAIDNYCPHCGAKMNEEVNENEAY